MLKKILSLVLIIVISGVSVGCDEKNVRPKTDDLIPNGEKTVLQLWTTQEVDFFDALGKEFLSELKNYNIKFKVISFKDEDTLHEFLLSRMAEDKGPDLVFTGGEWIAQNKHKFISMGSSESFSVDYFKETFVKAASEILTTDSTILGVPLGIDSLALIFNDEHIADRLPGKNVPSRTWEKLREDVVHLTKADNSFDRFASSGIALGRSDNVFYAYEIAENMLVQMGTVFLAKDARSAKFHKSSGISSSGRQENYLGKTIQYFASFGNAKFKNQSWNDLLVSKDSEFKNFESFAKGETSMVFGYARDRDKIIEIARTLRKQGRKAISSDVIRVAYLPQINDPETNPNMRVVGKVYSMVVPITAKYPKLSWNFLKFAVKKDNIKSFGDETGIPVSRVDLLVEQENVPYVGIYARQAKFARPNVLPIIKKQDFKKTFNEILNNVVDKNINISRATNKWGQLVNIELSEYWKREKALERPSNKKKVPAEKKIEDKKK